MCYMQIDRIKVYKHFPKKLGLYFTDGSGSDGSVVKVDYPFQTFLVDNSVAVDIHVLIHCATKTGKIIL